MIFAHVPCARPGAKRFICVIDPTETTQKRFCIEKLGLCMVKTIDNPSQTSLNRKIMCWLMKLEAHAGCDLGCSLL